MLKQISVLFGMIILFSGCAGEPQVKFTPRDSNVAANQTAQFAFDSEPVGSLIKGAQIFSGDWTIRAEADAPSKPNALCQTGAATFPALSLSDTVYTDVTVTVQFKPIAGKEDQAAGIIFRVQDKDNYYILRANALEGNVNFYKYASGQRSGIQETSAQVFAQKWQELRVEVTSNRMRGFLNGQLVVQAADNSYSAGKVGLWTKADSVTCFDNVQISTQPLSNINPPTIAPPDIRAVSTRVLAPVTTVAPDLTARHTIVTMTNLRFNPSTLTVRVGQPMRLELQNTDILRHEFVIDNSDVAALVMPGFSQQLDFVFSKPGMFVYACNLVEEGDHRSLGMLGMLIVEPAP
ncbi:MAG: cupredoxin domain-containing protein [Chloroflexi bacterium]|nr:cupredoxin domain-containing protein [Chloroflexota bacterium]